MFTTKSGIEFDYEVFKTELHNILNWWIQNVIDTDYGGCIGRIDGYNRKHPDHPKSIILNSRILWSFSAAGRVSNSSYLEIATKCFKYIRDRFVDEKFGGLYWMLNSEGQKLDGKKQVYAQAFGIYAFTEYYLLTGNEDALHRALHIFDLLEDHARDPIWNGYIEAFSEEWGPMKNLALSEKEGNDAKTMNTHLHILESYTNLFRCSKSSKIEEALENLIKLYLEKFIDPESGRLKLFFDEEWNENLTHDSFGHEIESAWLLNEASEILGKEKWIKSTQEIGDKIASRVLELGFSENGGLHNERNLKGEYEEIYDWWLQAEAVIGFYDAYQNTGDKSFLEVSKRSWEFISKYIIDHKNGEWFWACDSKGNPILSEDKAGPWKAPYHNSRMCMEMMKRLK